MIGQTIAEDIVNDPVAYYLGEVDNEEDEFDDEEDGEDYDDPNPGKKPKKAIQNDKGKKDDKEECKNN